jgi:adenylate cyclase, class 2
MQTEIEAKWLNIDMPEMRKRLQAASATLIAPERLMIRSVFDYPDKRLEKIGDKVTLSYKQLNNRTLHGTKEVSMVVNDFNTACTFLQSIGLERYATQETKRESWKLGDVEIELDTWPWIPSFVEIEASSEVSLREMAGKLGLDFSKALHGSVETAYQAEYDVTEEEVDSWPEIRFGSVPDWLEAKRRGIYGD